MNDAISALKHTNVKLLSGGEVFVLDNGAVINAEAEAMLQALHSRSPGGMMKHLEIIAQKGPENFMKNFYVGYDHKSIGDCADTTIAVEGISMLAAKAIQDSPLYRGQETSTRYVDFSRQPFIDPTNSDAGRELLEMQRRMYVDAQEPTKKELRERHPRKEGEDENLYEKAIAARAFDITRSLLPAGASTNVAWHTDLRQAADRLLFLRHHPLKEVKEIAYGIEEALKKHHPNSFGHKRHPETEDYQEIIASRYYHHNLSCPVNPVIDFHGINRAELEKSRELFDKRPKKTELPKYLADAGFVEVEFQLDFGSFRDIQRHRAIRQRMPLLTRNLGFNKWYVENLDPKTSMTLPFYLQKINDGIKNLRLSPEEEQYFTPMGYNASNRFIGDLSATVYMFELRDSRFVHPTLQRVAHSIGEQISKELRIQIHVDSEPGRFDIRRGGHDILLK